MEKEYVELAKKLNVLSEDELSLFDNNDTKEKITIPQGIQKRDTIIGNLEFEIKCLKDDIARLVRDISLERASAKRLTEELNKVKDEKYNLEVKVLKLESCNEILYRIVDKLNTTKD